MHFNLKLCETKFLKPPGPPPLWPVSVMRVMRVISGEIKAVADPGLEIGQSRNVQQHFLEMFQLTIPSTFHPNTAVYSPLKLNPNLGAYYMSRGHV